MKSTLAISLTTLLAVCFSACNKYEDVALTTLEYGYCDYVEKTFFDKSDADARFSQIKQILASSTIGGHPLTIDQTNSAVKVIGRTTTNKGKLIDEDYAIQVIFSCNHAGVHYEDVNGFNYDSGANSALSSRLVTLAQENRNKVLDNGIYGYDYNCKKLYDSNNQPIKDANGNQVVNCETDYGYKLTYLRLEDGDNNGVLGGLVAPTTGTHTAAAAAAIEQRKSIAKAYDLISKTMEIKNGKRPSAPEVLEAAADLAGLIPGVSNDDKQTLQDYGMLVSKFKNVK